MIPNVTQNFKLQTPYLESCRACGGQKMAPHINKWSPLDGAHE